MKYSTLHPINQTLAALVVAGAFAITPASLTAGDIPLTAVPPPVVAAIMEVYPNSELIKAETHTKDGVIKYEVKILRPDGKREEIKVSEDGKILDAD